MCIIIHNNLFYIPHNKLQTKQDNIYSILDFLLHSFVRNLQVISRLTLYMYKEDMRDAIDMMTNHQWQKILSNFQLAQSWQQFGGTKNITREFTGIIWIKKLGMTKKIKKEFKKAFSSKQVSHAITDDESKARLIFSTESNVDI